MIEFCEQCCRILLMITVQSFSILILKGDQHLQFNLNTDFHFHATIAPPDKMLQSSSPQHLCN